MQEICYILLHPFRKVCHSPLSGASSRRPKQSWVWSCSMFAPETSKHYPRAGTFHSEICCESRGCGVANSERRVVHVLEASHLCWDRIRSLDQSRCTYRLIYFVGRGPIANGRSFVSLRVGEFRWTTPKLICAMKPWRMLFLVTPWK